MASAQEVGKIFIEAGRAFTRLGEMALQLQSSSESSSSGSSQKWTAEEVEQLHGALRRFGNDVNKIAEVIKSRTIAQIKSQIRRKEFGDAGLPIPKQSTGSYTLNALNADDADVDVESLGHRSGSHVSGATPAEARGQLVHFDALSP